MIELREIKNLIGGEVLTDTASLDKSSRDASIFAVEPGAVIRPSGVNDLKALVGFVNKKKTDDPSLSLTARAGGTDMSGGPLNDSIIVDFANFNKIIEVGSSADLEQGWAVTEPGVYYRDFEKATLEKGWLLPSYPASREMCMVGGMAANNAGGERSLKYGKTDSYVEELNVILSDGEEYNFKALTTEELEEKKCLDNFEGGVYSQMHQLLESNHETIQHARPNVSKNSAGYALWNVWDKKTFDLTKLFVGAQGTLGLITKIKFRLIRPAKHSKMLVVFLRDLRPLAQVVNEVMRYRPESFEAYDDNTLRLAVRFWPAMVKKMKGNALLLGLRFIPEMLMLLTGGMPKLVLIAEFTGDDEAEIKDAVLKVKKTIDEKFKLKSRIAGGKGDAEKYWTIRRESFSLLRKRVQGKKTAPFIDDIIVRPEQLPEFLPKLNSILDAYKNLVYTIAGHAGDGNFHVIPLMDLTKSEDRASIPEISKKVYNLVIEHGGSITAEHNDGLIRTPYLEKMYGPEIIKLFEQVKEIFDPRNIFNPRKKVGGSLEYATEHIKTN